MALRPKALALEPKSLALILEGLGLGDQVLVNLTSLHHTIITHQWTCQTINIQITDNTKIMAGSLNNHDIHTTLCETRLYIATYIICKTM